MKVEITDNSKAVLSGMEKGIYLALGKIGAAARDNAKENIMKKGVYDTGDLHDTFGYQVNAESQSVDIGSPQSYAIFNELGTVKMAARPFLQPAIMDNRSEYQKIAAETLKQEVKVAIGGMSTTSTYYQEDTRVANI